MVYALETDRESIPNKQNDTGLKSDSQTETIVLSERDSQAPSEVQRSIEYHECNNLKNFQTFEKIYILNEGRREDLLGNASYRNKQTLSLGKRKL